MEISVSHTFVAVCIALSVGGACTGFQKAQSPQARVQITIDEWVNRDVVYKQIEAMGEDGLQTLGAMTQEIARRRVISSDDLLRMQRSISILGMFDEPTALEYLIHLLNAHEPYLRCLSIHALMESGRSEAVPALIRKLEDTSICLKVTQTDPMVEKHISVADEAVRALEHIVGVTFAKSKNGWDELPRDNATWKKWWKENKDRFLSKQDP